MQKEWFEHTRMLLTSNVPTMSYRISISKQNIAICTSLRRKELVKSYEPHEISSLMPIFSIQLNLFHWSPCTSTFSHKIWESYCWKAAIGYKTFNTRGSLGIFKELRYCISNNYIGLIKQIWKIFPCWPSLLIY